MDLIFRLLGVSSTFPFVVLIPVRFSSKFPVYFDCKHGLFDDSEERWKSEGIQVGGIGSTRGVFGHWFDKLVAQFPFHIDKFGTNILIHFPSEILAWKAPSARLHSGKSPMGSARYLMAWESMRTMRTMTTTKTMRKKMRNTTRKLKSTCEETIKMALEITTVITISLVRLCETFGATCAVTVSLF